MCSLVPSIGKTESVAASSCKEVRDVLSNECSGGPQSGTYWITVTDPCTQHNRTMRVGQKHTCLGEMQELSNIYNTVELLTLSNGFNAIDDVIEAHAKVYKRM